MLMSVWDGFRGGTKWDDLPNLRRWITRWKQMRCIPVNHTFELLVHRCELAAFGGPFSGGSAADP